MPRTTALLVASILAAALTPLSAQSSLLPNGDFAQGTAGWHNIRFDDPAGSTGVAAANVTGGGISAALFTDFASAAHESACNWLSDPFALAAGTYDVGFAVMWQKPSATVIADPSGNYIEVFLLDSQDRHVFSSHLPVTRTASLVDRRSFAGQVAIPVAGSYRAYVIMAHAATANLANTAWVDDLTVSAPAWTCFGSGCPGTGNYLPEISARGTPALGSTDWTLLLDRANAPTLAILGLGSGTANWQGLPLPIALGGGCSLLVPFDATLFTPVAGVPGSGHASAPIAIPTALQWRAIALHAQWLVLDAGSGSPYGVTASRGLTFVVQ